MHKDVKQLIRATRDTIAANFRDARKEHDNAVATAARLKPLVKTMERTLSELDRQLAEHERVAGNDSSGYTDQGPIKTDSGSTNKEEVAQIVEELLRSNGAIPKGDLRGLVGDRLRVLGRNHKMFANIFPKALADDRFEVSPEGAYRLSERRDHLTAEASGRA